MASYRISELAERTGTPPSTLRFYDRAGLLPAQRSPSGYRLYREDAMERLAFIASGKYLGLPLADIRALLTVWAGGVCGDVRQRLRPLLSARIAGAEQEAAGLAAATARLRQALAALDGPGSPGRCGPGCGCWQHEQAQGAEPASPEADAEPADPEADPVAACTLAPGDRADRIQEWRRLLAQATRREPTDGGLRIHLPAAAAGPAAELAAAEQRCCAFLDFTLHLAGPDLILEVRGPAGTMSLLADVLGQPATGQPT